MALLGIRRRDGAGRVAAEALVLGTDPGFSAMSWWATRASLQVTVPGSAPLYVEAACTVHRHKSLVAGTVLPVDVDPSAPDRLSVRWDQVPTLEERIEKRDPAILDPEGTWPTVAAAADASPGAPGVSGSAAERHPWSDAELRGWPPPEPLAGGRLPGKALVVSCSVDPAGYRSGSDWVFPVHRYAGTIVDRGHDYLGWLLLCVIPDAGERFGVHVRKTIRRGREGPVLPVSIDPEKPTDVEIPWKYAPDMVKAMTERAVAANESALALAEQRMAEQSAAAGEALAAIADPAVRAQTEAMLKKFGV
jgi:hypothetical protein